MQPLIQEPPAAEGLASVAEAPKREERQTLWGPRPKREPRPTNFGPEFIVKRPGLYSYFSKKK
jgi:hypothetical protein